MFCWRTGPVASCATRPSRPHLAASVTFSPKGSSPSPVEIAFMTLDASSPSSNIANFSCSLILTAKGDDGGRRQGRPPANAPSRCS